MHKTDNNLINNPPIINININTDANFSLQATALSTKDRVMELFKQMYEMLNELFANMRPASEGQKLFARRDELVFRAVQSNQRGLALLADAGKLRKQITNEDLDAKIAEEQARISADDELVSVLNDENALINNLTAHDAQGYSALSAFAYAEAEKKSFTNQKRTKADADIASKTQVLENFELFTSKLSSIVNEDPSEIKAKLQVFVEKLQELYDVKAPINYNVESLFKAIEDKKKEIENDIYQLEKQVSIEQSEDIKKLQNLLDQNAFAKHLEAKGVFYRNDGEFSGFVAYDKEKHKLIMVFAGSKSLNDWVGNAMGWNAKASSRRGLLSNMNFHAGFLSHFESLSDDVFTSAYRLIENLSNQNSSRPLTIASTGHSLGGALAILFTGAAKEMAERLEKEIDTEVVTFGAPNTLHNGSVAKMNNLLGGAGNLVRFENSLDPVPKLCFWKNNPGFAVSYQSSFFYDQAEALQLFGQNPHGSENYYHSSFTQMEEWKQSTEPLREHLARKKKLEQQAVALENEARILFTEAHSLTSTIIHMDNEYSHNLSSERQRHIKQLEARQGKDLAKFEEARNEALLLENNSNDLTLSTIRSMADRVVTTRNKYNLTQIMLDDARLARQDITESKKNESAKQELNRLLT